MAGNGRTISRRAVTLGGLGALAADGPATAEDRSTARPRQRPDVDVVVVGAGYAGPIMANVLAASGKRVVVLEAGPHREMRDLVSSHIWARRNHGPYPVRAEGAHPLGVGFNIGWGLGGSGLHQYAAWPRMHPTDFEMRSRYGRGLDWPIGYDVLRPYYDRVQEYFGVAGDAEAEVWRPPGDPYPLPPHDYQPQARILARGFHDVGLRTAPMPLAVLSRPYRGRPACQYVAWCNAGCAIGALGHPLATVIPEARRNGVEFRTDARALRVVMERDRAAGIEYADRSGNRRVQRARLVIIAAWSLETPRILLNSGDGGVANSSGLVGRYMHTHMLFSVFGLFPEATEPHRGLIAGQVLNQDHIDPHPAPGYLGGYQWIAGGSLKPNDLTGFANARADINGPDLEPFMRRAAKHIAYMDCMGFSTPQAENRLELTDELDEHGLRKAVVTHSYDADALAMFERAKVEGSEIMGAADAEEIWTGGLATAHIMGGTVMGDDPASSVTNSFGQTHDVENLFLAGAGLFPSGGAVNPTFTLNALALRAAEHIEQNWHVLA